jgi:hypothetical protein
MSKRVARAWHVTLVTGAVLTAMAVAKPPPAAASFDSCLDGVVDSVEGTISASLLDPRALNKLYLCTDQVANPGSTASINQLEVLSQTGLLGWDLHILNPIDLSGDPLTLGKIVYLQAGSGAWPGTMDVAVHIVAGFPGGATATAVPIVRFTAQSKSDTGVSGLGHLGSTVRGQVGTYQFAMTNHGPQNTDLLAIVNLPPGASYVSGPAECQLNPGNASVVDCRYPTPVALQPVQVSLSVRNSPSGTDGNANVTVGARFNTGDDEGPGDVAPNNASVAFALTDAPPPSPPPPPPPPATITFGGPTKIPGVTKMTKKGKITLKGVTIVCPAGLSAPCRTVVTLTAVIKKKTVILGKSVVITASGATSPSVTMTLAEKGKAAVKLAKKLAARATLNTRSGAIGASRGIQLKLGI